MMERLRAETREIHARLEALPFFNALQEGLLARSAYVAFLEAMAPIHDALEQAASRAPAPLLAACWNDVLRRRPLLEQDLVHFQAERTGTLSRPLLHAIILAEELALRERRDPTSLLGSLYVLQGSALGGLVLRPMVARSFGLDGTDGLAYLTGNAKQTMGIWTAFTTALNAAVQDPALQQRVVDAAIEAFEGMEQVVLALFPLITESGDALGTTLNPEAGSHAIPDDPREIRAALRAGVCSWERFPYYEWRYSRRGRRYTRSDSAWLVTLAAWPQEVVDRNIEWLGHVLAARGMPRWLLEMHLIMLHDELAGAVPERQNEYGRLLAAADHLHRQRHAAIAEDLWHTLATGFAAAVGEEWISRLPESGNLLIAAVADERAGVTNAVSSLEPWMIEPGRFPAHWIAAVHHLLAEAYKSS